MCFICFNVMFVSCYWPFNRCVSSTYLPYWCLFFEGPFSFFFKSWMVLVSTWSMCCCVGDKLVCASLNGSVEGNGWYLYGILHGFVADVKSTIGEQTDW